MKQLLLISTLLLSPFCNGQVDSFTIYNNKAIYARDREEIDSSLHYQSLSRHFCRNLNDLYQYFNTFGTTYFYISDCYTALSYFDSAKSVIDTVFDRVQVAHLYNNYGVTYMRLKQFDIALEWMQKAMVDIENEYKHILYLNIGLCYKELDNKKQAIEYLKNAFRHSIYIEGMLSYNTLKAALELAYYDEQLLQKIKSYVFEYNDNDIIALFYIRSHEYGKAEENFINDNYQLLLLYNESNQWLKAIDIIDTLRNSYLTLEQKLWIQANEHYIYKNAITELLYQDTLKAFHVALRSRANLLREALNNNSETYLPSFNYFDFDTVIYLFHIDSTIHFYRIAADSVFKEHYRRFSNCLQYDSVKNENFHYFRQYCESAYYLYQKLMPEKSNKMYIIPDGRIHYIPFEALLTAMPDTSFPNYKTLPYLLNSSVISYGYILQRFTAHEHKKSLSVLAPDESLEFSQKIARWLRRYKGHVHVGAHAIYNHAKEGDILHIEAHYNPANRIISLADTNLSMLSIDSIDKDLVVLSTCYSDFGINHTGEGVFSPGREFFKAGAQAVLASIWESETNSNFQIIKCMYKNMHAGKSLDNSVTLAKRKYLNDCLPSQAHPFFWAHLRIFGNTNPLNIINKYLWLGLSVFSIIAIVMLLKYFIRLRAK